MRIEEYFKVAEIAKKKKITTKTVRNKIQKLIGIVGDDKIFKDNNNEFRIHKSLLNKFEAERKHGIKYIAINIDPVDEISVKDLEETMSWIIDNTNSDNIEINYSIEQKKKNNRNHIHLYAKKDVTAKIVKNCKIAFPFMSYHLVKVYDLTGWKNYIGKESKIITLKKRTENGK